MDLLIAVATIMAYEHQKRLEPSQQTMLDEARRQVWGTVEMGRLANNVAPSYLHQSGAELADQIAPATGFKPFW